MDHAAGELRYRLRLGAGPESVFALLSTDQGRMSFWVEHSRQRGEELDLRFPDGQQLQCRILERVPPTRFALTYFGGSTVSIQLRSAGTGTDLGLHESNIPAHELRGSEAGWVSVLLNLKARADHGIDLRNHDPGFTWNEGYVDN